MNVCISVPCTMTRPSDNFINILGLNAGIMMMNLTQMREFNFQNRAMAAQVLYDGKIALADQDIVNIIFHGFPGLQLGTALP